MRVIGTAGHVDHGKSTLVAALTGIHPDRLKEEQEREMTIDLGFAWLALPGAGEVGIVDVPGHRDFIENMLAGVGGIDAALLVIAADEGIMPQTREHLDILDLLQVPAGVVALTKTDLVEDAGWLELVEADIRQALAGTTFQEAPIYRVSARRGDGLEALKAGLDEILHRQPTRPDLGRPRLPVDRVFSMAGFGTVVTGTLVDGGLRVGDEIEILPGGLRGRVRGLQSHKRKAELAVPGSRTAVNVSGVEVDQVRRGDILVTPGRYRSTQCLDVHFRMLPNASAHIKHNQELKLYLAAAEIVARVRLLGSEELLPGQSGWLQLELNTPTVALRGDRFILRRPSPGETLGGGVVVDAHPAWRHKRFAPQVIRRLEALLHGSPAEVLLQTAQSCGYCTIAELIQHSRMTAEQAWERVVELVRAGSLVVFDAEAKHLRDDSLVLPAERWQAETGAVRHLMREYHTANPLRLGMPREELKSRLKYSSRVYNVALPRWIAGGILRERGGLLADPDHEIRFSHQQQAQIDRLLERFAGAPYAPPSVKECRAEVGEDVFRALVDLGRLVPASDEVVFRREDYAALVEAVRQHFAGQPTLSVAKFRDRFQTSRKYALAFLESLDRAEITVREGDVRKAGKMLIQNQYSNR
ncbi:MAG: selenocysteine-specific translation elongation factor [Chloroflexi bacterium]|nr:selenocysteine-specific translation elongation factor [Chloroflexota bacterium]